MVAATKIRSEVLRKATQQQGRVASPVGGLNFVNSTMDFPDTDAYVLDNILAKPYGCQVRKGWQNWIPAADTFGVPVKTILTFAAEKRDYSALFCSPAVDPSLIYDITTQDTAPTVSLTPSSNSDNPGEWYYTNFVTEGGNFLLAVSAGAGYYSYSAPAGVGAWVEHVDGDGTLGTIKWPAFDTHTSKDIAFIWLYKRRVWFFVKESSIAYYLPTDQFSGVLAAFDFGQQFNLGGANLWATSWTYDSGAGIDDSLIIASTEGQVLVYEGSNPDDASDFHIKGRWYGGRFPVGRRNFCEHGGDVVFICEYGTVSISDLVAGRLHTANLSGTVGFKINPRLAELVTNQIDDEYWFLQPHPSEELMYMGTPVVSPSSGRRQYLGMNSLTNAWSTFSAIDTLCAAIWYGKFIFGTSLGMVNQGFVGVQDNVSSDGVIRGDEITARLQGNFNDYGAPNQNKRMLRIKVYGLANIDPRFYAIFRDEYDVTSPIGAPISASIVGGLWDDALWDDVAWSFGEGNGSFKRWFGVTGFGKKLSLQLALRGGGRVVYTDHESLFETGIGL